MTVRKTEKMKKSAVSLIDKPVRASKRGLVKQIKELRSAVALEYILSEEDRKKRLTEVAMSEIKEPVPARDVVLSIAEINRMERIGAPESTVINFNEIKILVVRETPRTLPEGEKPKEPLKEGE